MMSNKINLNLIAIGLVSAISQCALAESPPIESEVAFEFVDSQIYAVDVVNNSTFGSTQTVELEITNTGEVPIVVNSEGVLPSYLSFSPVTIAAGNTGSLIGELNCTSAINQTDSFTIRAVSGTNYSDEVATIAIDCRDTDYYVQNASAVPSDGGQRKLVRFDKDGNQVWQIISAYVGTTGGAIPLKRHNASFKVVNSLNTSVPFAIDIENAAVIDGYFLHGANSNSTHQHYIDINGVNQPVATSDICSINGYGDCSADMESYLNNPASVVPGIDQRTGHYIHSAQRVGHVSLPPNFTIQMTIIPE